VVARPPEAQILRGRRDRRGAAAGRLEHHGSGPRTRCSSISHPALFDFRQCFEFSARQHPQRCRRRCTFAAILGERRPASNFAGMPTPFLAATNKCLARNNKSGAGGNATKKTEPPMLRACIESKPTLATVVEASREEPPGWFKNDVHRRWGQLAAICEVPHTLAWETGLTTDMCWLRWMAA